MHNIRIFKDDIIIICKIFKYCDNYKLFCITCIYTVYVAGKFGKEKYLAILLLRVFGEEGLVNG